MADHGTDWQPRHVETGRSLVRTETEQLRAEREAFDAFAARVNALGADLPAAPAVEQPTDPTHSGLIQTERRGRHPRTERIRAAYRDTVMAVDHYEETYGESLGEHLAAELGDDVAGVVVRDREVSRPLCSSLVRAAERAKRQRSELLEHLSVERESLESCAERLVGLERERLECDPEGKIVGLEQSFDRHATVCGLEADCRRVVSARQATLLEQTERLTGDRLVEAWCQYLYADENWLHPVLTDAAEVARRLARTRERLAWQIARVDDRYDLDRRTASVSETPERSRGPGPPTAERDDSTDRSDPEPAPVEAGGQRHS